MAERSCCACVLLAWVLWPASSALPLVVLSTCCVQQPFAIQCRFRCTFIPSPEQFFHCSDTCKPINERGSVSLSVQYTSPHSCLMFHGCRCLSVDGTLKKCEDSPCRSSVFNSHSLHLLRSPRMPPSPHAWPSRACFYVLQCYVDIFNVVLRDKSRSWQAFSFRSRPFTPSLVF